MTGRLAAEAGRLTVDGAVPRSKSGCKVPLVESLARRTLLSPGGRG